MAISFPKLIDLFNADGKAAIGRELLLDDGLISIVVESMTPNEIICKVVKGGTLKNRKSINIPRLSYKYALCQCTGQKRY